ncbi:MAG: hypothetical protein O7B26_04780 [Planctomycetota bacterium]|nr:hypothetical protein [Planctomycetota bacterium]
MTPTPSSNAADREQDRLYPPRPTSRIRYGVVLASRRLACAWSVGLMLMSAGCQSPEAPRLRNADSLDVDEILQRCVENYTELKTFTARGSLRDCRTGTSQPIEWDYIRPNHLRLQIGMKLAVVDGADWWTYTQERLGFRKHRRFTSTPLRTTAHLLSGGVPLFLPAVFETGRRAFGDRGPGWFDRWTFQKVDWRDESPCYVLANRSPPGLPGGMLQLWIDQDRFLLRGWVVSVEQPDGRLAPVWECTYTFVAIDVPVAADRFRLIEPRPEARLAQSGPPEGK